MLHIFSKRPLLSENLERIEDGDALLFIETAVYSLIKDSDMAVLLSEKQRHNVIYALQPDLKIRGILPEQLIDHVQLTDYAGFVQLTVDNQVIHSWH